MLQSLSDPTPCKIFRLFIDSRAGCLICIWLDNRELGTYLKKLTDWFWPTATEI